MDEDFDSSEAAMLQNQLAAKRPPPPPATLPIFQRSQSLPHVIRRKLGGGSGGSFGGGERDFDSSSGVGGDSGVSLNPLEEEEEDEEGRFRIRKSHHKRRSHSHSHSHAHSHGHSLGDEEEEGEVQGDFASGGSGMCPSEPPESSVHSEVQAVKQLVLHQIDKKLKDLRTLKQHYYPEGGWGWVILVVSVLVQGLVWGAQLALAMYVNLVSSELQEGRLVSPGGGADGLALVRRDEVLLRARVHARRLVYGVEVDASKGETSSMWVRLESDRGIICSIMKKNNK